MNINWRVRFQNKTFLTGLISLVVVFVYDLLQLLEIAPTVTAKRGHAGGRGNSHDPGHGWRHC